MKKILRTLFILAALIAANFMGAAMARAAAETVGTDSRADRLEQQAVQIQNQDHAAAWKQAAKLYIESAKARPAGDPRAVRALVRAANLQYYVNKPADAMRTMQKAGDRALKDGNIFAAAEAYARVAWIAEKTGRTSTAQKFAKKAEQLASSPELGAEERAALARVVAA
jgi:hypothetical protein